MKPEALKELQQAAEQLNYCKEHTAILTKDDLHATIVTALQNINAAVFIETPNTSRKFDLYKFTSKETIRPTMTGIYHEGGYKVASDAHVLAAIKEEYDPAQEGHIIGKKGEDIMGPYPKFRSIYPKDKEGYSAHKIDFDKVYGYLKEYKAAKKVLGRFPVFFSVGDAFFDVELFATFCTFMEAYGFDTINVNKTRAACVGKKDETWGLIMPVYLDDTDKKEFTLWNVAA